MIELKGIIEYCDTGNKYVDVVVREGQSDRNVKHQVGVDIKVNRGTIITFLAAMYKVKPGDIVWPGHIKVKEDGL